MGQVGGIPKLVHVLVVYSTANKDAALNNLCTLTAAAIKEMANGNRKNQDAMCNYAIQPSTIAGALWGTTPFEWHWCSPANFRARSSP